MLLLRKASANNLEYSRMANDLRNGRCAIYKSFQFVKINVRRQTEVHRRVEDALREIRLQCPSFSVLNRVINACSNGIKSSRQSVQLFAIVSQATVDELQQCLPFASFGDEVTGLE